MQKAVITGSTGGIGRELATLLSAQGWSLILVNRPGEAAAEQASSLSKAYPEQSFEAYGADLMEASDIETVIEEIKSSESNIDMLCNVAGILTDKKILNSQGIESHLAVNTLAPYLFTRGLQSILRQKDEDGQSSIVVNFSTSAVFSVKRIEIPDLPAPEKIGGLMGAYAESKLALDILTCSLKPELLQDGILIESIDPGATKTSMTRDNSAMPWFIRMLRPLLFKSPQDRAKIIVESIHKCIKDKKSGLYISEGKEKSMPEIAENIALQRELRTLLEELIKR